MSEKDRENTEQEVISCNKIHSDNISSGSTPTEAQTFKYRRL